MTPGEAEARKARILAHAAQVRVEPMGDEGLGEHPVFDSASRGSAASSRAASGSNQIVRGPVFESLSLALALYSSGSSVALHVR